jgi:universal stress protein E
MTAQSAIEEDAMSRIHNILVIVDPTATEHPAIDKAARIAEKFGARLELFACETKQSRAMRYAAHLEKGGPIDFVAHVRAILETLAKPLRSRGLDVSIEVGAGDPLHAQLLERTRDTHADLVVKDTHHHSLLKRTLVTNTDWHLIRGCPVPLLLTKARPWADAPSFLAALDPGHVNDKPVSLDTRILEWARSFRERLGGTLRAVHAYLPLVLVAEAANGVPASLSPLTPEMMEQEGKQQLDRLRALTAPHGVSARDAHAQVGVATAVIPRFAEETRADVVAMGAISRSGLERIFIGSTAESVLESLPCDVLVVKPLDFAATLPF